MRVYYPRSSVMSSARLPEYAGNRYHRHARHFDGTAGSSIGAKSLGRDHRTRAFRRESFCFVLFSRPAHWLISLIGRCSSESSAIQQARIQPILEPLADFESLEIGVRWI